MRLLFSEKVMRFFFEAFVDGRLIFFVGVFLFFVAGVICVFKRIKIIGCGGRLRKCVQC